MTVAAGGTLQGGYSGAGSLALGGLSFGGSGIIAIGSLAIANTSSPVISIGGAGLSTNGANSITITVGSLTGAASGTVYQLLGYSSIGGTGTSAFQLAPLPGRAVGALNFPAGLVDLNITGADYLHWSGAASSAWDTTTGNWTLNSNGGTTTFINGSPNTGGDTVVFDNAAGPAHSNVTVATTVYPSSVTVSSSNNYTISGTGSIGGPTGVTINGPGSVTLGTSNSYTGTTNVNGGVLNDGAAGSFGSGALAISGGTVNAGNPQSLASATLNSGLLNLAGPNALSGVTLNFSGGTLDNTSGSAMTLAGNNPQNWNASFIFRGSNSLNLGSGGVGINNSPTVFVSAGTLAAGGATSGAGGLTKNGPGVLILSGVAGYGGATTVSNGTLALTNAATPTSTSFSVAAGASLIVGANIQSGQSPSLSGDGTVTLAGANTLNINTANFSGMNSDSTLDFEFNGTDVALINSGDTPLASFLGTLNIGSSSSAQIGNVTVQCNVLTGGGTLGCPTNRTIALNVVGPNSGTFSGNLSFANSAIVNLTLSGAGTQVLSGNNSGLGTVNINSGVLNLQSPNAWIGVAGAAATVSGNGALQLQNCGPLASAAMLNLGGTGVNNDGALRNVAGNNTYSGPINLQADSRINSDSGLLTLTGGIGGGGNLFFGGAGNISVPSSITSGGNLTMDGSGVLTLGGNNNYGGDTFVNNGSLLLNSGSLASYANVSVAGGATFGGAGLAGNVTVAAGGTLQGGYNGAGSLSLAALNFGGSGTFNIGTLAIANTASPVVSLASGGLSTNGANSITITVGSLTGAASGTVYQLLGYGSIGGTGTSAFQLAPLPSRAFGYLSFPAGLVDLNITGADYLHWSGAVSSAWNTSTANWKLNSNGGTTTFINGSAITGGDTVVFDNAAGSAHSSVALATTVYPSSVTVSSSNSYSFSGSGSIGGQTAVTINGPGGVTVATSNSYTGGANVNGGVLNDGAAGSFGSGVLTVSGGTVNVNNAQSPSSVNIAGGLVNLAASAATLGSGPLVMSAAGTATLACTTPAAAIGTLSNAGTGSSLVVLGNASTPSSATLTINEAAASTFGGTISDQSAINPAATGAGDHGQLPAHLDGRQHL